jgi:hypothetical protein
VTPRVGDLITEHPVVPIEVQPDFELESPDGNPENGSVPVKTSAMGSSWAALVQTSIRNDGEGFGADGWIGKCPVDWTL